MVEFLKRLIWDEAWFERYSRLVLLGVAGAVVTGDITFIPKWVGVLLMSLAGLIGAGDKNTEPNKAWEPPKPS